MDKDSAKEFATALKELERGERAMLRRNAGETIASSRDVMGLFYRILPPGMSKRDEEVCFLVATMFALNHRYCHEGDFGTTMAAVRAKTSSASLDRRVAVLLDSEFDMIGGSQPGGGEMAYRLRHLVKLAAGQEVGVDWEELLEDLSWWGSESRRARKKWARSYFAAVDRSGDSAEDIPGGE
jgi:CRISPR type I-E-associated protein CasB/Cse2